MNATALATHTQRARLFADGPETKPRHITAGEVIALVLEQHQSRDVAALTVVALENLPSDYGGIRRALQELVADEIRRRLAAANEPRIIELSNYDNPELDAPLIAETPDDQDLGPARERKSYPRTSSPKWQAVASAANDPLQARVLVAGIWRTWATLAAEDLREMARADERRASALIQRVLNLDQLAADMDAAGVSRLANLPDAAARIEALGC